MTQVSNGNVDRNMSPVFTFKFENETLESLNSPKYNSTAVKERERGRLKGKKEERRRETEKGNPLNKKIYQICIENLTFLPCIMNLYS